MNLIEVDVIGLQAFQRCIASRQNVVFNEPRVGAQPIVATGARNFAREDDLVAIAGNGEPGAENSFCACAGFRARWYGIHLCGVDKIHAVLNREIKLRVGIRFSVLFAPGHRAKADDGDVEMGVKERAAFHERRGSLKGK